jgi:hypothetical protein
MASSTNHGPGSHWRQQFGKPNKIEFQSMYVSLQFIGGALKNQNVATKTEKQLPSTYRSESQKRVVRSEEYSIYKKGMKCA